MLETRMNRFRAEMAEEGLDVALITDDDNVYYLTGLCCKNRSLTLWL